MTTLKRFFSMCVIHTHAEKGVLRNKKCILLLSYVIRQITNNWQSIYPHHVRLVVVVEIEMYILYSIGNGIPTLFVTLKNINQF